LSKVEAKRNAEGTSLSVIMHFTENEWFTNKQLKKEF
jgi:hypothetical protein